MTEVQSSTSAHQRKPRKPKKPAKPYPDFPLTPHPSGRWCKKVMGKLYYFGAWDDPQAALNRWLDDREGIYAGRGQRSRRVANGELTLRDLVNTFLTTKQLLVASGELSPYTWHSYDSICAELIETFGRERLLYGVYDGNGPTAFTRLALRAPDLYTDWERERLRAREKVNRDEEQRIQRRQKNEPLSEKRSQEKGDHRVVEVDLCL